MEQSSIPTVSLKRQGLRLAGDLTCPQGGRHEVAELALVGAKARGGGALECLKCHRTVQVVPDE